MAASMEKLTEGIAVPFITSPIQEVDAKEKFYRYFQEEVTG